MLFWGWFFTIGAVAVLAEVNKGCAVNCENCTNDFCTLTSCIILGLIAIFCFSRHSYNKLKQDLKIAPPSQNNTTTTLHKTYQVPTLTDEQINQIVSKCKTELFSQTTLELLGKSISNKLQFEITTAIQKRQEENLENEISYGRLPTEQEKRKERNKMTDKLRNEILTRDNHTCKNCGLSRAQEPHLCLHVDHIIPISKGGKTHEKNLQTLCWECNLKKGNKTEI